MADAALDLIPSADSAATSTKISVNVQASGTNSVSVYANMDSSAASNNLYLDVDSSDTTCVISAVDDTITLDALPANTWGYSVDGINYFPMPTASSSPAYIGVASIDSANTGSVSLYYGASVDTSLPAGKYSNTVKYSAVANAGTTPDITSYTLTADGATTPSAQQAGSYPLALQPTIALTYPSTTCSPSMACKAVPPTPVKAPTSR